MIEPTFSVVLVSHGLFRGERACDCEMETDAERDRLAAMSEDDFERYLQDGVFQPDSICLGCRQCDGCCTCMQDGQDWLDAA